MALKTAPRNADKHRENSFALAVAVLREQIADLPKQIQGDLFELLPDLLGGDAEEQASALQAVNEILEDKAGKIVQYALPAENGPELGNWLQFIGKTIRTERESAGLTQMELAKKAGIPQPHLSRIENGQHSPTAMTREKLAKALNIPLSKFDPSA
ncbi:helix-turn-helix domain-containing protein [Planctomicrobium piriforme]|uniref:Helix-turn-helix n=1 Tax=Planctomicrobium piriforme TaxID=1576369 RepID=A0A1I3G031_9PLAN|nr:helix-turn-helix transcriptional regulator [Planctomicrobium piriforme]SFI16806.1 Helix-turn-helix [Planctomicrobium piriforme]